MKISIKKLLVWLIVLSMVLAGCGAGKEAATETEAPEAVQPRPNLADCTELGTPLADIRVRQALIHAIDMDTVIEALFHGNGRKAVSFTEPGPWLNPEVQTYEYDPEKAKELLAEAGWPSEYVLDVVYYYDDPLTLDVLNVIGSYWDAVGVKSSFRKLEGDLASQLWLAPENPEDDDARVSWDLAYGAVAALSESEFYGRFASTASNNSHTPPVEGLDELISRAEKAPDEASQKKLYGEIQKILAENVLAIPLYHQDCFIYTGDAVDTAAYVSGNDQFAYEKDILNWTTQREDLTLYTNGGPTEFFCDPTVNPGQYLYQELIFERLLKADSGLIPTDGLLAESHTLSDDGLTLEFTLREELFWQDGEPLTAEDVKFTFELYMKCPGANSVLTGVLDALEGAADWKDGTAEECTGITLEENKITFRFAEPRADVLKVFSQWPVLPKHCLEDVKPERLQRDDFWEAPVGSGPFRVGETVFGEYCVLERWEEYRTAGEGNIQKIYMAASGETDENLVLWAQLDRLDYAWGKSTDEAAAIAATEGMKVQKVQIPYTRCFFVNKYPHESYHLQLEAAEPTE